VEDVAAGRLREDLEVWNWGSVGSDLASDDENGAVSHDHGCWVPPADLE